MYIQQPSTALPFSLPRGYRGSAFEAIPTPPVAPVEEPSEEPTAQAALPDPEAAPAFAPSEPPPREGGLLDKLPFLSQLLPPPRGHKSKKGGLPEWAILGIILLLLLDSPENDLLPFLLILLLWD
jgi:hypothetical protein